MDNTFPPPSRVATKQQWAKLRRRMQRSIANAIDALSRAYDGTTYDDLAGSLQYIRRQFGLVTEQMQMLDDRFGDHCREFLFDPSDDEEELFDTLLLPDLIQIGVDKLKSK